MNKWQLQKELQAARDKAEADFLDLLYETGFQKGVTRGSFEEGCRQDKDMQIIPKRDRINE